ncbi:MFS transporter [Cellulosimicrobium sp. CUA-896]|uniref:MFS transporter n=1 Tax=Cellulosimicrobium sp. CUA-896 TaxID=1517881 RepID=UPI000966B863|nr:MFS transporter [Cellulosimicrobium sp. CUA-896]OLT52272.1 Puromycin resistance protein pur8 [Cellulosimicrobium sp. CUA-896]
MPVSSAAPAPHASARRWTVLAVVSLAQLMVVLDGSVVNIALPDAQADLGTSDVARQWIVTAYGLAFGGLLLVGGRFSDRFGRRRMFLVGLIGFAVASGLGGLAADTTMLIVARALQGVFAALLAPAVLSVLTLTFPGGRDRATAFGVFSAVAAGGGAVGLLLGGMLTEWVSWRWTLLVNVVIAIPVAVAARAVVPRHEVGEDKPRIDLVGAVLATGGLVALVYGFTSAELDGWTAPLTLGLFAAAVLLMVAFVVLESRVRHPLLPLRVVADRNRGGAYLATGLAIMAMFGQFLLLTYYFQLVLGYTPIQAGLAFIPLTGSLVVGSTQIGARLVTRVAPRYVMAAGYLVAALGFATFLLLGTDSSYWAVLPGSMMLGLGTGTAGVAATSLGTSAVAAEDAGVASAMLNTSQQLGGAIGTALLATVAASVTAGSTVGDPLEATMQGYLVAFGVAAGLMVGAAALAMVLVDARPERHTMDAEPSATLAH